MGVSYTITELIQMIQEVAGTNKPVKSRGIIRKNDYPDVVACIEKAKTSLNWSPKTDMKDALFQCLKSFYEKG